MKWDKGTIYIYIKDAKTTPKPTAGEGAPPQLVLKRSNLMVFPIMTQAQTARLIKVQGMLYSPLAAGKAAEKDPNN